VGALQRKGRHSLHFWFTPGFIYARQHKIAVQIKGRGRAHSSSSCCGRNFARGQCRGPLRWAGVSTIVCRLGFVVASLPWAKAANAEPNYLYTAQGPAPPGAVDRASAFDRPVAFREKGSGRGPAIPTDAFYEALALAGKNSPPGNGVQLLAPSNLPLCVGQLPAQRATLAVYFLCPDTRGRLACFQSQDFPRTKTLNMVNI